MGLDAVEFVFALEDAFQIGIPDHDAAAMLTPRSVVDYLIARLPGETGTPCHSQRAFYRLRAGVAKLYQLDRQAVHPQTPWDEILPSRYPGRAWAQLQKTVGTVDWPAYGIFGFRLAGARTVGATATYLATKAPAALKREGEGWSRPEVEGIVRRLMSEELGIRRFDWDDRFVQDLHVE